MKSCAFRCFRRLALGAGVFLSYLHAAVQFAGAAGGAAKDWGDNRAGELGNGTTIYDSATPVQVSGLGSGVTAVAAGNGDTLAVQNGAAKEWGANAIGELGIGTMTDGSTTPVQVTGLGSGVTAVAVGSDYSLAIQNGAVKAWGINVYGQLGNGTTNDSATPVQVSGLGSGVTAVAAGYDHGMAIQNGAAKAWGNNGSGQLGNGTTNDSATPVQVSGLGSGVTAVAAGSDHSLAVQNGAAKAWGSNYYGQLGNGTKTDSATPVQVLGLTSGVTAVAAGSDHSLAVQNGHVYAWGANDSGQLGNGTTTPSLTPIEVDAFNLKSITAVAVGMLSSYALSSDGSLWVWGDNSFGELGLGTTATPYLTPQHLLPPDGFAYTAISSEDSAFSAVAILSAVVPEPSTWTLLLIGAIAAGCSLRRRAWRG